MKDRNKSVRSSPGKNINALCHLLTMLFCALRACDIITWKWYWVVSPLFISGIIGIIALIIAGAIAINLASREGEGSCVSQ